MTKQTLLRLSLAVLRLHLNQHHLQHGGLIEAIVGRLYAHLRVSELGFNLRV